MKNLIRNCPICNNKIGNVLYHQIFSLPSTSPLPKEYDVVSCEECGFCFADTPKSQEVYDEYYTLMSKYEDEKTATGGSNTQTEKERFKIMVQNFAPFLNKNSAFLDIGCANGGLLDIMKEFDFNNIKGIDVVQKCIDLVKQNGHNSEIVSVFNIEKLQNQKFDFIVLSHVLEHLKDVNKAIINLDKICNKNGYIYIEVPDAARYSNYFIKPFYYFDCEHINHFDTASLENLFMKFGYEKISVFEKILTPVNDTKYPALGIIFQKKSEQIQNIKKNQIAKNSIQKFISDSEKVYSFPQLNEIILNQQKVIVWGAGQYTLRLMVESPLSKCNILNFVDNDSNKLGKTINKIEIESPKNILQNNPQMPIVIVSALYEKAITNEIIEIDKNNLRKIITL